MENDEPFSMDSAWAHLRHLAKFLLGLFGDPAALAARLMLTRGFRQDLLGWLAPLEAVARRLLAAEAAKLPAPNAPGPRAPIGRIANTLADKPQAELGEDSAAWRVVFNLGLRRAGAPPSTKLAGRGAPLRFNALSLARRVEALCRVLEDRAACVRKLAARLHGDVRRARKAYAPYRFPAMAVGGLLQFAQDEAERALAPLCADTS